MPNILHIYGASGSGTTTLGRALAARFGCPFLDTDDVYWLPTDPPYTTARPIAQRLRIINAAADAAPMLVLAGSLTGWGDPLIPRFRLAVWLTPPTDVRLARLRAREAAHFGDRILPGGDMAANHAAFLQWASEYDTALPPQRSRALHEAWTAQLPCQVLMPEGTRGIDELAAYVASAWCKDFASVDATKGAGR